MFESFLKVILSKNHDFKPGKEVFNLKDMVQFEICFNSKNCYGYC